MLNILLFTILTPGREMVSSVWVVLLPIMVVMSISTARLIPVILQMQKSPLGYLSVEKLVLKKGNYLLVYQFLKKGDKKWIQTERPR